MSSSGINDALGVKGFIPCMRRSLHPRVPNQACQYCHGLYGGSDYNTLHDLQKLPNRRLLEAAAAGYNKSDRLS